MAEGVPQNYAEALKWYRLAADQGDASAQYNLGVMYDNGQGVPQNYAEALKWYRLAADQGNASAQHSLGLMSDNGISPLSSRVTPPPARSTAPRPRGGIASPPTRATAGAQGSLGSMYHFASGSRRRAAGLRPRTHVVQLVGRAGRPRCCKRER